MVALMRQSIFSRLADYEDTNDAERLSVDPSLTLDLDTPEYYKRLQTSNPVE